MISWSGKITRFDGFRLARASVCLAALFSLASCNYLLGSPADKDQSFKKTEKTECVKDVGANVKNWFEEGQGDIGESVDCAVLAIDEFTSHVVGQTEGQYTRAEMATFLKDYLAQAGSSLANDTDAWTHEAMTMKQLAFGGGTGSITKEEVGRIRAFLLRAKPVLISITPHIRTMFFKDQKVMPEESSAAVQSIDAVTKFISEEFNNSVSERPTTSAEAFLSSARRLGIDSSKLDQWVPIASAVKAIVVGGEREKIRAEEWTPMLQAAGRVWALSLRYKFEISKNDEWLGDNFSSTEEVLEGFMGLLETAVQHHADGIQLGDWEALINSAADKKYLPEGLTAPTLNRTLPTIFGKLLYGNSHEDRINKSVAFGPDQFATLNGFVKDWILGEKLIIATFGRTDKIELNNLIRDLSSEANFMNAGISPADKTAALKNRADILTYYTVGRPLTHDSERRLMIVPRDEMPAFTRYDLDKMNILRIFVQTVMRGWTHDPKAAATLAGLTADEAQEVYLDVKDIGYELGFMDVRNNTAGTRTFMEGSIFTSVADGSDRMTVRKGVEWFHFVMSGGGLADQIHAQMVKEGCGLNQLDILGKPVLRTSCFREKFIYHFAEFFPNMPHLVNWVKEDRSGARAQTLILNLEGAGRTKGAIAAPVELTELRSMIPILFYSESLFARHDVNRNDMLDNDELWNAFPILAPFIKQMGGGHADGVGMQKAIFSYLVKFGEPPAPNLVDTGKLLIWRVIHGLFKDSADRAKVLKVIASFGKAATQSRIRDIGNFVKANKDHLKQTLVAREPKTDQQITDLFQCHPDAADLVGATFARNVDYITSGGSDVNAFVQRGQVAIASEPRLLMKCLPF